MPRRMAAHPHALLHSVEHDEVGIFCQLQAVGAGLGKVAIGFVYYHDAVET